MEMLAVVKNDRRKEERKEGRTNINVHLDLRNKRGGGDSSVVRAPDFVIERSRVRIPAGTAGEFSSPGSTFCADSYFGIRSTPVLPQWHVKNPGHSAKSAGGRLQLNTHTPYVCGFY